MQILPKSISPLTKWCAIIVAIITTIIALGPGGGYFWSFVLLFSGPFSYMAFIFGVNGWVPQDIPMDIWHAIKIVALSASLGFLGIFLILCHSYWRKPWAALLTIIGYLFWMLCSFGVTFISV